MLFYFDSTDSTPKISRQIRTEKLLVLLSDVHSNVYFWAGRKFLQSLLLPWRIRLKIESCPDWTFQAWKFLFFSGKCLFNPFKPVVRYRYFCNLLSFVPNKTVGFPNWDIYLSGKCNKFQLTGTKSQTTHKKKNYAELLQQSRILSNNTNFLREGFTKNKLTKLGRCDR